MTWDKTVVLPVGLTPNHKLTFHGSVMRSLRYASGDQAVCHNWYFRRASQAMKFLRQYWIAGLVLLLVLIHAVVIGYVRSEARQVKITASNEIPIGVYYIASADKQWLSQLRVHVLVKRELRLSAKATMEMHRWLIHEAVEEQIRQLDPALLTDPALLEVKRKIKAVLEDTLEEELIERIVINDRVDFPVHTFQPKPAYDLTTTEPIYTGKPVFQPIKPSDEVEVR